jgi:hypothetical protein
MTVTFGNPAILLTNGCKSTHFTVFMDGVDDPVDTGITSDGFVGWVD